MLNPKRPGDSESQKGLLAIQKQYSQGTLVLVTEENYLDFEKDPMSFLQNY